MTHNVHHMTGYRALFAIASLGLAYCIGVRVGEANPPVSASHIADASKWKISGDQLVLDCPEWTTLDEHYSRIGAMEYHLGPVSGFSGRAWRGRHFREATPALPPAPSVWQISRTNKPNEHNALRFVTETDFGNIPVAHPMSSWAALPEPVLEVVR